MDNDIMIAQEAESTADSVMPAADQESGEVAGSDASAADFSDADVEPSDHSGEGAKDTELPAQPEEKTDEQPSERPTADQNAANAERRREAERRRAEERDRIRRDTILEVTGGVNPYTNESMKDDRDVAEYLEMREIERQGGDPVADYAKYHKKFDREREDQLQRDQWKQEQRARVEADREEFSRSHPDVKISELFSNNDFVEYATGKLGKVSLSEIYDAYNADVQQKKAAEEARIEARAKELAAQMVANASASPGSAVGAPQTTEAFTPERMRSMSRAEVRANYDKLAKEYWK